MNMELLIRQGYGRNPARHHSRGADDSGIRVKVTHAWFEGPMDMNIHIAGYEGPSIPLYDESTGDYVIPNPKGPGLVRCYSVMLLSGNRRAAPLPDADRKYMDRLRAVWDSPCEPRRSKRIDAQIEKFMAELAEAARG